jgi:peptidoglycan/xylan/chitin deacetylase (PgdA/CDA1 family)
LPADNADTVLAREPYVHASQKRGVGQPLAVSGASITAKKNRPHRVCGLKGTIIYKKTLKRFVGRVAGSTGIFRRNFRSKMFIVAFHRVNDRLAADGLTVGAAGFEAFCDFFARYFSVVPLSEQVDGCHRGKAMGGTLSITFDDGYVDNFEVAAPILKQRRLPASLLVSSGFIGTGYVAPWDRGLPDPPKWMTWEQLRELTSQGFEVGSHTHTHINLAATDPEDARKDILASRETLERELGRPASLFAYPFGGRDSISALSRRMVRDAGFDCCVACFGGANYGIADPYYLNRIGIAEWFATPEQFGLEILMNKA